jgi:GNAT superfamily N-acetyltransferase
MVIRIRRADEKDQAELARLFLRARTKAFGWQDASEFALSDFARETAGEIITLAEDEHGTLIGFISVWEEDRFVHHLFVDPQFAGKGVGSRLLDSLQAWLPPPYRLKCLLLNTAAHSFYRRRGWHETGRAGTGAAAYAEMIYPAPVPGTVVKPAQRT